MKMTPELWKACGFEHINANDWYGKNIDKCYSGGHFKTLQELVEGIAKEKFQEGGWQKQSEIKKVLGIS